MASSSFSPLLVLPLSESKTDWRWRRILFLAERVIAFSRDVSPRLPLKRIDP